MAINNTSQGSIPHVPLKTKDMKLKSKIGLKDIVELIDIKISSYNKVGELVDVVVVKSKLFPFEDGFKQYMLHRVRNEFKEKSIGRLMLVESINSVYVYNKIMKFEEQYKLRH